MTELDRILEGMDDLLFSEPSNESESSKVISDNSTLLYHDEEITNTLAQTLLGSNYEPQYTYRMSMDINESTVVKIDKDSNVVVSSYPIESKSDVQSLEELHHDMLFPDYGKFESESNIGKDKKTTVNWALVSIVIFMSLSCISVALHSFIMGLGR